MPVVTDDFLEHWTVRGAAAPVSSDVAAGRDLASSYGATPPRQASYSRRRGAEFRTSTFEATNPAYLATPGSDGLEDLLYVSSKIQSFTVVARVRANRSGSTATSLCPVFGVYSTTNKVDASVYHQPVLALVPKSAGASRLVVVVGDRIFDTLYATQEEGPSTTTPIGEEEWTTVAVVIAGSPSTNNQIDSVRVFTESAGGVRRAYLIGARKAGARLEYSANPTDGQTVTIDGTVYTFKTSLGGTPATGTLTYVAGVPTAGQQFVVGDTTYTFVSSLGAVKSTATIEFNNSAAFEGSGSEHSTKPEAYVRIGGYEFTILWGTGKFKGSSISQGYIDGWSTAALTAPRVNDIFLGTYDNDDSIFRIPRRPNHASPDYTAENGVDWKTGLRTWSVTTYTDDGGDKEVVIEAAVAGSDPIPIVVVDGWKNGVDGETTGAPSTWRVRVKSGTVESGTGLLGGSYDTYNPTAGKTQGILTRGAAAAAPNSIVIAAGDWPTTKARAIAAINATASAYHNAATANAVATASDPGGDDILLTSKLLGTAGNGKVLTTTATAFTAPGTMTGGSNGSDSGHVKIGATDADSWGNLVKAINDSGTRGIDYGSATSSAHASMAAAAEAGAVALLALAAGSAGNGKALSTTTAATIKDEFGDVTVTTTAGGCAAGSWVVAAGSRPDQPDLRVILGGLPFAPATTDSVFFGTVSDIGLYEGAMTFGYFADYCYTPPPVSARDAGWYRGPMRGWYSAKTDTMSAWRGRARLAQGSTSAQVPITLNGSRVSLRLWGVEAGRPMGINRAVIVGRVLGGVGGSARAVADFRAMDAGVDKGSPRDGARPDALADANNITFHNRYPRRRRGYRVECVSDLGDEVFPSAVYDATTASGESYQLFFAKGTLYLLDNGNLTSLDTGWPTNELPTVATVGEKTFICCSTRQRVFKAGTIFTPGVAAPASAPTLNSVVTNTDGVVVVDPGWEYVVTFYDGTRETDSAPSASLLVLLPPDSERATLTLGIPVSDSSTVTKRKLWKRKRGAVEGTYFLVSVIENNTATEVSDSADQPSTIPLEVFGGLPVTAEWPGVTSVSEHDGRLVGYGGEDRQVIRYSEVGDGERWHPYNSLRAKSEVVSVVSHEGRDYILTDSTVEVVDGEFVRGSSGALVVSRKILDTSKGAFGPFAADVGRGRLWWCDPNGLHVIGAGQDQQDVTKTVSWPAHPFFANAVDTSGTSVVVRFNHVSQDLWILMTRNDGAGGARNRIALVYSLDTQRWVPYDHSLSWVSRVKDSALGRRLLGCDYLGNILELDVWDGDGCQGNESWMPDGGKAIASISGKTITFSGTSLPTTLRGVSAVFEDISASDAPFRRATILSSTSTTITVDEVPSWLVVGDKVHVGGIIQMLESAEADSGSPDPKHWTDAALGLSNLVVADL